MGGCLFNNGFTFVETLVATLIAVVMIVGVANLGERMIHQRVSADSNSGAVSLAEEQMEKLLALSSPSTNSSLTSGTHGPCGSPPCSVDSSGASNASGPYKIQWVVSNSRTSAPAPLVTPTLVSSVVKKITVTVTHLRNPSVGASVVTYYKVS